MRSSNRPSEQCTDRCAAKLNMRRSDGKMLPTWMGELYLEFHRGTYTSHGSIKRHNRKSEILLKELEYLATLASLQGKGSAYVYPKSDIDPLWEKVLLCQFHDVLPGSAIGMVSATGGGSTRELSGHCRSTKMQRRSMPRCLRRPQICSAKRSER